MAGRIATCLWFDGNGHEAAEFYVGLFPNAEITSRVQPDPGNPPFIVNFTLDGAPFQALNGGSHYTLTPAASITWTTEDQAETDRLWEALLTDGGSEMMCGWLTDRFGLSWQIVPRQLQEMLASEDRAAADRATQAMMQMVKIDIAKIEAAFADG